MWVMIENERNPYSDLVQGIKPSAGNLQEEENTEICP